MERTCGALPGMQSRQGHVWTLDLKLAPRYHRLDHVCGPTIVLQV